MFGLKEFTIKMIALEYCRYDPSADINGDTDTEQDRIIFIKSVAEFMVNQGFLVWFWQYLTRGLICIHVKSPDLNGGVLIFNHKPDPPERR